MAEEYDREELQRALRERERERAGDGAADDAAQESALESLIALQELLSGGRGPARDFVDFRRRSGAPRITDVEPRDYVAPGQALTIRGEHLDRVRQVRIGGRVAESVAMVDQQRLVVVVPLDARSGRIELSTDELDVLEPTWNGAGAHQADTTEET
jgi:hypothetical protein